MHTPTDAQRDRVIRLRDRAYAHLGAREGLRWLCAPNPLLGGLAPLAAAWIDPEGVTSAVELFEREAPEC